MGDYRTAFPDFILDVEIPACLEDLSYANDGCPSFGGIDIDIHVFVRYPGEDPRFVVEELSRLGMGDKPRLQTNSWDEVLKFIEDEGGQIDG